MDEETTDRLKRDMQNINNTLLKQLDDSIAVFAYKNPFEDDSGWGIGVNEDGYPTFVLSGMLAKSMLEGMMKTEKLKNFITPSPQGGYDVCVNIIDLHDIKRITAGKPEYQEYINDSVETALNALIASVKTVPVFAYDMPYSKTNDGSKLLSKYNGKENKPKEYDGYNLEEIAKKYEIRDDLVAAFGSVIHAVVQNERQRRNDPSPITFTYQIYR